ncbi:hypothetical protein [uncultured Draconibacterium sp.]|uniref:hypothetical protein n=1 Tax=uncultured Draconibacterium sp. TaxID=1573823 RepID=UPI003216D091
MKTIKTILLSVLMVLLSFSVLAVSEFHKGDTIRYKFDKMLIEVASTNAITKPPHKLAMQERVQQIQKVLDEMTVVPPADDERITISFRDQDDDLLVWNFKEIELSRTKRNTKSLVVFDDGTTFDKDFGRYCIFFSYRAMDMKLFIDDLDNLSFFLSEEFEKKAQQSEDFMKKEFGEKYKKGIVAWLDLRGDEVKAHYQNNISKNLDMLLLSGGIGSGWIKNTFVSDINFRLGVSFSKKGMFKNLYAVDYSMMYDFSESNENKFFELNHFVALTWEHNFSNTPVSDKWYGFSVGYLVKRNNDFFKENTFKIAVNKKINDTFIVKPELYFNDFFKNVYPGIRLSVAF